MFEVVDVVWVEAGGCLEELQRLLDLTALALDERLDVDRVLAQPAARLELLLDELQALWELLQSREREEWGRGRRGLG